VEVAGIIIALALAHHLQTDEACQLLMRAWGIELSAVLISELSFLRQSMAVVGVAESIHRVGAE
jgi:hypothetical protein